MSRSVADEADCSTGTISTAALSLEKVPRESPFTERMNGNWKIGICCSPGR